MIRLSLPNTMIPLIVLLTLVLNMSLVSAQDNFTATVGQDMIFTEFNSHAAWFDRSPGFNYSLPEPREAISSGNLAHVSLSASQDHEGIAVAKLGVNITWDMNGHTWDEIKDWPIDITFNYHYNIESNWVEGNGSANAWIQTISPDGNDLTIYQQIGHLVGQAGSSEGESIEYLNTTLGVIGDRIWLDAFCEAGSYASSIHTSSATLQLYSITIEFENPPNTPIPPIGPPCGSIGQECVFMSMAEDPDGDDVKFIFDWGDGSTSETEFVKSGMWKSAPHQWSTHGLYEVKVKARDSKGAVSDWSQASTIYISAPPAKPLTPSGPDSGFKRTTYSFSTSAIDPDEGDQVKFAFDWGDGSISETGFVDSGSTISESHRWSSSGTYQIKVMATDTCNVPSEWSDPMSITIVNRPPIKPILSGPTNGYIKVAYLYSTQTIDPDEDDLRYNFYWGDDLVFPTGLVPSGTTVNCYHVWDNVGKYAVRTEAIDEEGASSELSNPLDVTISDTPSFNLPPNPPNRPLGPSCGDVEGTYNYLTRTIDPNGDLVKYAFDWGDGSISETEFVDSGSSTSKSHRWSSDGTYVVRAKATDSKNASSEWSAGLEVKIKATKVPDNIGVFRNGPWYLDFNGNRTWDPDWGDVSFWFGTSGDLPFAGDWNGDCIDEIGVFRNGPWYLDFNGNREWDPASGDQSFWFGTGGDLPIAGDWNGDGIDEIGVFRNGPWYLDYNGNRVWDPASGDVSFWFGTSGDLPIAGDWNGDGKDEIGVFRNGPWYLDYNGNRDWDPASGDVSFWFGTSGDAPLAGDWNSDGRDEIGVFRSGPWYMDYNGNREWDPASGDVSFWFGTTGDKPVAGRWGSSLSSLTLDNDKPQLDLREISAGKIYQKRAALEELQEESSNQIYEIKIAQETLLEKHRMNSLKP